MGLQEAASAVKQLRMHLHKREHAAFLSAFNATPLRQLVQTDNFIKALGGEALCLLLEEKRDPVGHTHLLKAYEMLLLDGVLLAPYTAVFELARRLRSRNLRLLGERLQLLDNRLSRAKPRAPTSEPQADALKAPVIEIRRFVQSTFMEFTPRTVAETSGMRKSVFRSEQERSFQKALALRFPALQPLPNYPLDQIAELSNLRETLGKQAWSYGKQCRIDAVLVIPDEGRPVAAFELDSSYHDRPDVRRKDKLKDAIFMLLGLPYFRLRVESPATATTDDWYSILTEEVVPRLDLGREFRHRSA